MTLIPANGANGTMDLAGLNTGNWVSLKDLMTVAGKLQPAGINACRINAKTALSIAFSPSAVGVSPGITPMVLPIGGTLELFEQEQIGNFRILDNGPMLAIQYYHNS